MIGDAYLVFRADANYKGKERSIPNPEIEKTIPAFAPYKFIPAQWIANARVSLRDIKDGPADAEVGIWAKNLFNDDKVAYPFPFGDIGYTASHTPARTYGVDFIVNFWGIRRAVFGRPAARRT